MVMDSPVHGRGLFAARDYAAGETVLVEAPLVKMQDVGNRQDVLVCSECLCFLDVSRTLLAKTNDADRHFIVGELTLKHMNFSADGMVTGLS